MHRSRLHVVVIDSPPESAEQEVAFWAAALGRQPVAGEAHQPLQDGDARIHVDLETDDVPAEVRRLEALGAVALGGARWLCPAP